MLYFIQKKLIIFNYKILALSRFTQGIENYLLDFTFYCLFENQFASDGNTEKSFRVDYKQLNSSRLELIFV